MTITAAWLAQNHASLKYSEVQFALRSLRGPRDDIDFGVLQLQEDLQDYLDGRDGPDVLHANLLDVVQELERYYPPLRYRDEDEEEDEDV